MRPGLHRASLRMAAALRRFELALGGVALFLGHGREALALAGVLALAGMVAALAGALALAGVGADAVAFTGGIGHGRHGGAGQEQSGCSGGNGGAGPGSHLHVVSSYNCVGASPASFDRFGSRVHPQTATRSIRFGYTAS